jgi:hypothetical protein
MKADIDGSHEIQVGTNGSSQGAGIPKHDRTTMMTLLPEFERLEQTIGMIQRHPYYPGKEQVVDECLRDIDERHRLGWLTDEQRGRLRALLGEPNCN